MSLTLLQGYSSAEDEEKNNETYDVNGDDVSSSDGDELNGKGLKTIQSYAPLVNPNPPSSSGLPSAFEAFSEIAGPPKFLNHSVKEAPVVKEDDGEYWRHGRKRNHRRDKKDLPSGAVLESKPQLVGIHERVRSDVDSKASQSQASGPGTVAQGGRRVATAGNPNAEDAAELLRMCVRCGIPKTFSHDKGMVCPVCGDKPQVDSGSESVKKKSSAVKDKEKSKRMKGQSSHATWKSETEMHLRQQFD